MDELILISCVLVYTPFTCTSFQHFAIPEAVMNVKIVLSTGVFEICAEFRTSIISCWLSKST